jgi:hypothetical protein
MAGVNAYAGRFVGNDFVLPKSKPKKIINTTPYILNHFALHGYCCSRISGSC